MEPKRFIITAEQLESLVADAQHQDMAAIIRDAVMRKEIPVVVELPRDKRQSGFGAAGLKRIRKWMCNEMNCTNYHHRGSNMLHLVNHLDEEIRLRDPQATFYDTDDW